MKSELNSDSLNRRNVQTKTDMKMINSPFLTLKRWIYHASFWQTFHAIGYTFERFFMQQVTRCGEVSTQPRHLPGQ